MDPQTFGRYRIVRKLAGGGMGRVFLVWDPDLNQNVGLKLIDTGHDQESLDVVAAERSGANLQDQLAKSEPGGRVAQIFDVGERDGYFFIAMEYVEGEDLSEIVSRGPLPPEQAVRITIDVLAVLARAHNFETVIDGRSHRGIIHGDIKPRNIRITPDGRVKVLDFGIAKAVSMTRSITFNQYGSVPYSSPERIRTGDVDARSDVWSVAVVLFEMLTGRAYFTADTSARLEVKIRDYAVRSHDLSLLPPELQGILARALDPDFSRRFPSASAFEQILEAWYLGGRDALLAQDPDATRRTVLRPVEVPVESPMVPEADATQRSSPFPQPTVPPPWMDPDDEAPVKSFPAIWKTALLSLVGTLSLLYAVRQINKANEGPSHSSPRTSSLIRPAVSDHSVTVPAPHPSARSTETDYAAEAEHIIADYRKPAANASAPDWQRAQTALESALALSPDDPTLRGKLQIVDGHLRLGTGDKKGAEAAFEHARTQLPQSPDPSLGLTFTYLAEGDPGKAEDALNDAKTNGFEPGRRENRALGEAYRKRGEYWLNDGRNAKFFSRMQTSLKRAESDLGRAKDFYTASAPFPGSTSLIARVIYERQHAASVLSQAGRLLPKSSAPRRQLSRPQARMRTLNTSVYGSSTAKGSP